jgi:hypothetical protein
MVISKAIPINHALTAGPIRVSYLHSADASQASGWLLSCLEFQLILHV